MAANGSFHGRTSYHTVYQTEDGNVLFEWETNLAPAAHGEVIKLYRPAEQSYMVSDVHSKPYLAPAQNGQVRLRITVTVKPHPANI